MCRSNLKLTPQQRRTRFGTHFIKYLATIAGLWLIWALTGMGHPWPIYPMLGWGSGVLSHYLAAGRPQRFDGPRLAPKRSTQRYQEDWDGFAVEVEEQD